MTPRRHPLEALSLDPGLADGVPGWEQHAHSRFSDGKAEAAAVAEQAWKLGLSRLIFTEHTEPHLVSGPGWFGDYAREVRRLAAEYAGRMEILLGLEVPALDFQGGVELDEAMAAEADFVLGAVHALPGQGWLGGRSPEQAIELEHKALLGLLDNPRIDALAHPGGITHLYVTPFPMSLFDEVVRRAAERGVAIEMNPAYQDPLEPYLACCRRHGARISPGSNAHHLEGLGWAWRELSRLAVRGSSHVGEEGVVA
ncbi:MAG: PHP domain-containing protein [Magnetococcales bacterium]|nr:PHP domain-containing protein [Magnetococcales bacterium]